MATSIFFNGRVISVPGAYSEVDASGLDVVSLGAAGIVAVLGTAVGGRPVSDIVETKDIQRFTSAEKASANFRSGQLLDVANMLFRPAKDPDIPAGAVEYVAMKTNPATQSTAVLPNIDGPTIDLTSEDYGAFTEQITVDIQDGTTEGKLLTITFEDIVESVDDLGGETLGKLKYVPGPDGYDTAVATVSAAGNTSVSATRANIGLDGDLANPITNVAAEILSASVGDVSLPVELFGTVAGVPTVEVLTTDAADGTVVVVGTVIWDAGALLAARITGTSVGVITVRELGGAGVDVFTLAAGVDTDLGLVNCDNCHINNTTVDLVSSGASTNTLLLFGRDVAGATVAEAIALTGTTPITSTASTYAFMDVIVLGGIELAETITMTAIALLAAAATFDTILKLNDFVNSKQQVVAGPVTEGFIYTLLTGQTKFDPANFDQVLVGQDILDPADFDYTADLFAIIDFINTNSQLVTAAKASGATGVPDNTSSPVPLQGGIEGVATFVDFQNALNLLKRIRVNSIVDLSGDPAVAAAVDAHCALMGGIGRSERDGFVGVLNSGLTNVPTKDEYKAAIVNLNTRHIRAFGQAIERNNPAGVLTEFLPPFEGAIAAGAQAGSPVGTSLTHKFMNVLGFRQDPTWNPTDDAEEMVKAGACFLENVDGVGRRFVRNVTTHLTDNNIAFVEASVNESVNFAVFNFRTNLEFIVGQKGFSGTVGSTRSNATSILGLLVDAFVLVGFQNLDVELILDVMDVSIEMAPIIPINFVRIVVHLVTLAQLAA